MQINAPFLCRLALCAAIGLLSGAALNQDEPPSQPFQAVHLINLPSAEAEKALVAAFADINAAIAKAGCPNLHISSNFTGQRGAQAGSNG